MDLSLCVTTWDFDAVRLRLGGCAVRLGPAAGDYSHVYVEPGAGLSITCYRTNRSRRGSDPLAVGDSCWVSWHPADCILWAE